MPKHGDTDPAMKIKIGTVDSNTGLVFAGYGKTYKNGEWWVTSEKYELRKIKEALNARKRYHGSEGQRDKILKRNKKWRSGDGEEWCKLYDSSEPRIKKKLDSEKHKYWNSDEFRKKKLETSRKWSSSPSGRKWDSDRKKKPEERKKIRERRKAKIKSNPVIKASSRIRNKTYKILKAMRGSRSLSASKAVGLDIERLKSFIECQFANGMDWSNMGDWHIDHFIPMATAETVSDVKRLSHYSNLRPMWAIDNLRKGGKIPSLSDVIERSKILDKWHAEMGGVTTQGMEQ
jgi:hypothetical protein